MDQAARKKKISILFLLNFMVQFIFYQNPATKSNGIGVSK
jgi:hypothetical protein